MRNTFPKPPTHPNSVPYPAYPTPRTPKQKPNFVYKIGDPCHFCGSLPPVITIWTARGGRFAGQQLAKCNENSGGCGKLLGVVTDVADGQIHCNDGLNFSTNFEQSNEMGYNNTVNNENSSSFNELVESVEQLRQEVLQLRSQVVKGNKFLSGLLLQIRDMCNSDKSSESTVTTFGVKKVEASDTQKQKSDEIEDIQEFGEEEEEEMKVFTQQPVKKQRIAKTSN